MHMAAKEAAAPVLCIEQEMRRGQRTAGASLPRLQDSSTLTSKP